MQTGKFQLYLANVKDKYSFGSRLPQPRFVYISKDLASDSIAFLELSITQRSKRGLGISQNLDLAKENG